MIKRMTGVVALSFLLAWGHADRGEAMGGRGAKQSVEWVLPREGANELRNPTSAMRVRVSGDRVEAHHPSGHVTIRPVAGRVRGTLNKGVIEVEIEKTTGPAEVEVVLRGGTLDLRAPGVRPPFDIHHLHGDFTGHLQTSGGPFRLRLGASR